MIIFFKTLFSVITTFQMSDKEFESRVRNYITTLQYKWFSSIACYSYVITWNHLSEEE